jgi:hypothetical protein
MAFRLAVCVVAILTIFAPRIVVAQDTLSDSAWKADIARRAALRHHAEATRDSLAQQIDSIAVDTHEIALHIGDTLAMPDLVRRLRVRGRLKSGAWLGEFPTLYKFSAGGTGIVTRDNQVIAESAGESELLVQPMLSRRASQQTIPTVRVRLSAH